MNRLAAIVRTASVVAAGIALVAAPGVARPSLRAPAREAQPENLPDTPAARVAKGFLAMVGDGTEKAVFDFEAAHASASRRGSVELSERAQRVARMREEWGALTIESVLSSTDSAIALVVRSANIGVMEMEFQLSEAEPGKLEVVMIRSGGGPPAVRAEAVTPEQVASVAEAACAELERSYVFPEVAKRMSERVRGKLRNGEYASIRDERELAMRLTEDFRSISNDKHLRVNFAPMTSSEGVRVGGPAPDLIRQENHGFRKVELLPGNIGYLRFDFFNADEDANRVAAAAMNFLANADAIIFDMRYNGGGSPEMIRFITSYLFEKPTHLNSMIDREGEVVEEYWTLGDVPGSRPLSGVPVYVLTSSRTFSGAEEFSYNLKNLKRATIVGETTGGGAHPVRGERLNDRFTIGVPFMRAFNPITKTNWEGTGVEPDIKVPAAEALDRAVVEARKTIEQRRRAAQPEK